METTEDSPDVNLQATNAYGPGSTLSRPSTGPTYQAGAVESVGPNAASFVALMSVMAKLESILRRYLFEGMKASRVRRQEEDIWRTTFTDAVRLRLAYRPGEDFVLVWLYSPIGYAISQARSVEDLRDMLGDYLFAAMEASNQRKEEKRRGILTCTGGVNVSFPNGKDGDSKLEIILGFDIGRNIHAEAYPS
ncbi:hypothetical protein BU26DRAFT_220993 [Trematosphaeria pertusa]|uniref:Uncharacterized protein n=1 Tax=Trematosphaeria pertusa TaxID=390896 RepID=A0A6A6ITW9_9PLEO|nr:uncharacterized protein BU26DRAFT_220993 [Trematosphaeria pertusa]KAF2253332.1 hypothetical protein BU26DRAFT_220993 [Trematosphaeria pertusa]